MDFLRVHQTSAAGRPTGGKILSYPRCRRFFRAFPRLEAGPGVRFPGGKITRGSVPVPQFADCAFVPTGSPGEIAGDPGDPLRMARTAIDTGFVQSPRGPPAVRA